MKGNASPGADNAHRENVSSRRKSVPKIFERRATSDLVIYHAPRWKKNYNPRAS